VLNVTALGPSLDEARSAAYSACSRISFDGMQYRRDIGTRTADVAT
jgi:phosphoribosylamine--glycine ligase